MDIREWYVELSDGFTYNSNPKALYAPRGNVLNSWMQTLQKILCRQVDVEQVDVQDQLLIVTEIKCLWFGWNLCQSWGAKYKKKVGL